MNQWRDDLKSSLPLNAVMKIIFGICSLLLVVQLVYPFVTVLLAQVFGKKRAEFDSFSTVVEPENQKLPVSTAPPLHCPATNPVSQSTLQPFNYACIITAYRNAAIAEPLVASLLRQTYPNLVVYLVADECPEVGFGISDERFVLLRPELPLRLKVKSIIHALAQFKRSHEYVVIFDADNLAHPQFLEEINRYAQAGHRCIQGQRTAKNLDTNYAALDSMGEHYKNYIEREVPYRLGGSAVISGSGMATETDLYKAYLACPDIERGKLQGKKMLQEDKILQNFLLRRNERIAYARHAVVFDEKVETGAAVETQRSRWLFSYFQNLPNSSALFFRGLFRLSFNQFYFGFVTLVLPMFIQVGLAGVLALAGLFIAPWWSLALVAAIGIFALNILLVLRLDEAPPPVWRAVRNVPKFVLRQFASLLKMRDPNKHFKHTEHRKTMTVEEVLKNEGEN